MSIIKIGQKFYIYVAVGGYMEDTYNGVYDTFEEARAALDLLQ